MVERKYKCQRCKASYDSIKQYINHLEEHKEGLVDVPKTKLTLFQRIFRRKIKPKNEEKQMADDKTTEVPKPPVTNNEERFSALERSISELTKLVTTPQTSEAPNEVEEAEDSEQPILTSKVKNIRLTITVNEKNMPELIKEIQDNEAYEMENIEVLKE